MICFGSDPPFGASAVTPTADVPHMRDAVAILALALATVFGTWLVLAALTLVNRLIHDARAGHEERAPPPGSRRERRLLRRAGSHRTKTGRWNRITALHLLVRERHPESHALLDRALLDPDREVVGAAVRALGELGDDWAARTLVETLKENRYPRSRVASQLDGLAPGVGPLLVPLLDDPRPPVRFWAATLVSRYPGLAVDRLVAHRHDEDANVRAAVAETLGEMSGRAALSAVLELLEDRVWYVRVHACRAAGRLGGAAVADRVAPCLADSWWWVRAAAKDALRDMGSEVATTLVLYLDYPDGFARNGAAELLQDIGFVDALASHNPDSELLRRIYAAGGPRLRESAERRAEAGSRTRSKVAAVVA